MHPAPIQLPVISRITSDLCFCLGAMTHVRLFCEVKVRDKSEHLIIFVVARMLKDTVTLPHIYLLRCIHRLKKTSTANPYTTQLSIPLKVESLS